MEDCIFCKIIAHDIPAEVVYEDNDFLAFLDITPVNLGHTLIAPKKHYRNIFDMPDDLMEKLGILMKKLGTAVRDGIGADGINIGWNNEPAAGQVVFHSHTHIIPRFDGDGHKMWGGIDATKEDLVDTKEKIKKMI